MKILFDSNYDDIRMMESELLDSIDEIEYYRQKYPEHFADEHISCEELLEEEVY